MKTRNSKIVVVAVLVLLGMGGWFVYRGVSIGMEAEEQLIAIGMASDLLSQYVRTHDGRWPHSWADLEKLKPTRVAFKWPEESRTVQHYVVLEFDADPEVLSQQTPEQFHALHVRHAPYYNYQQAGERVLQALQETHQASTQPRKE